MGRDPVRRKTELLFDVNGKACLAAAVCPAKCGGAAPGNRELLISIGTGNGELGRPAEFVDGHLGPHLWKTRTVGPDSGTSRGPYLGSLSARPHRRLTSRVGHENQVICVESLDVSEKTASAERYPRGARRLPERQGSPRRVRPAGATQAVASAAKRRAARRAGRGPGSASPAPALCASRRWCACSGSVTHKDLIQSAIGCSAAASVRYAFVSWPPCSVKYEIRSVTIPMAASLLFMSLNPGRRSNPGTRGGIARRRCSDTCRHLVVSGSGAAVASTRVKDAKRGTWCPCRSRRTTSSGVPSAPLRVTTRGPNAPRRRRPFPHSLPWTVIIAETR